MNLLQARYLGFCDGVRRAVTIARDAARQHGALRTDGPLVHNSQVIQHLAELGVGPDASAHAPFLVRAHGISPEEREALQADGVTLVDATCPHISRNQQLALDAAVSGCILVIAGDRDHAEVKAVAGAAVGGRVIVVETPDDLARVPDDSRVVFLAQTTFSVRLFREMADALTRRFPDCRVIDTICRATHLRQEEAARVAEQADVVVVVGGRNSANTRRLAEIVRTHGKPAVLVETEAELNRDQLAGVDSIGVISGASTPDWIIDRVVQRIREYGGEK